MKPFLIIAFSVAFFACHRTQTPSATAEKDSTQTPTAEASSNSATIAISPGPGAGETTISWNTGSEHSGQVYVSVNGGSENLCAAGRTGEKKVNWIRPHSRYEFRLYEASAHSKLLATVKVPPQS